MGQRRRGLGGRRLIGRSILILGLVGRLRRQGQRARIVAAGVMLFAVTAPATALERFRSDKLPCASVQQTLDQAGAAVIQYPSMKVDNYLLYDRYVASSTFCRPGETTVPATVVALDSLSCSVLTCMHEDSSSPYQQSRETVDSVQAY